MKDKIQVDLEKAFKRGLKKEGVFTVKPKPKLKEKSVETLIKEYAKAPRVYTPKIKTCLECGNKFTARTPQQKYCCQECSSKFHMNKKTVELEQKNWQVDSRLWYLNEQNWTWKKAIRKRGELKND